MPIKMLEICTVCGKVGIDGVDLIYDEYVDRFLCDRCDTKNEIKKLGK